MNVYLSPSIQTWNQGLYGTNESVMMNYIADALVPYLKMNGINFTRNSPSQTLSQIIAQSNSGNYDLHLALHSNAAPGASAGTVRGSRAYYYTGSTRGREIAQIFTKNFKRIYPLPDKVGIFGETNLAELRDTRAPSLVYEVAFHDNYEDAQWIRNNVFAIAQNFAQSIAELNGTPFVSVCTMGMVSASSPSFAYSGLTFGEVCNVSTVLNLRSQPNTTSNIIARLPNQTRVLVLGGNVNGWVNVRINDLEGFVSAGFLCVCNLLAEGGDAVRSGTVSTSGGNLNIRSAPSTTSSIIGSMPNGSFLTILGESAGFYKIFFNGITGFASKDFIRT